MEANQKSWLAGCGCGCLTFLGTFPVVGGLIVLMAWLIWEFGDVRHTLVEGPAALTYGTILGLLTGGVVGLIAMIVVKKIAEKKLQAPPEG